MSNIELLSAFLQSKKLYNHCSLGFHVIEFSARTCITPTYPLVKTVIFSGELAGYSHAIGFALVLSLNFCICSVWHMLQLVAAVSVCEYIIFILYLNVTAKQTKTQ